MKLPVWWWVATAIWLTTVVAILVTGLVGWYAHVTAP